MKQAPKLILILLLWAVALVGSFVLFGWTWLSFSYKSTGALTSDTTDELVTIFAVWEGTMLSDRPHRVSVRFTGAASGDFRYFPSTGEAAEWPGSTTWPAQGNPIGVLSEALVLERVQTVRPEMDEEDASRIARDVLKLIDHAVRHDYSELDLGRILDRLGEDGPPPGEWERLWVWGGGERASIRSAGGVDMALPLVPPVMAIVGTVLLVRRKSKSDQPTLGN